MCWFKVYELLLQQIMLKYAILLMEVFLSFFIFFLNSFPLEHWWKFKTHRNKNESDKIEF